MSAKEFFSRGWTTRLGFWLGKYLPPKGGRFVGGLIARVLVTLKPDIYHAVYANQRRVLGEGVSEAALRWAVYRVFLNAARAYYELFHNVGWGRVKVEDFYPCVRLLPESREHIREALGSGRGVFFLGCHTSNFDLGGIALSQFLPVPLQALSLADPTPGFEVLNALRKQAGMMVTPISPSSLRSAMGRLQAGGAVITGVDRPLGEGDNPVEFFGMRAYLPTGYIRIPLRTRALVLTLGTCYEEGEYRIMVNPPLEMVRTGDRERDAQVNLQQILAEIEGFIRRYPDQWMMFMPVWRNP